MRVYFSGIGGVGIGPLAEIAADAGHTVCGSDREAGLMTAALEQRGLMVSLDQSGAFLRQQHAAQPFDWLVHTAALPADHPELVAARDLGIRTGKRDDFLAQLLKTTGLKLIAVTGTHGKTTTTGMLIWTLQRLGVPVSYSVGSTLSFGPSGQFNPESQLFVYECDEFDRNFLHFQPWLSVITSVGYDHPDTYPTEAEYLAAFRQFGAQSEQVLAWREDAAVFDPDNLTVMEAVDQRITLAGQHNRRNATLVLRAMERVMSQLSSAEDAMTGAPSPTGQTPQTGAAARTKCSKADIDRLFDAINTFPGTGRRLERLADNLYSDYGHHPAEISATLQLARELNDQVVLIYQPHQNTRQHQVHGQYTDELFARAKEVYWLPTYLTREDPSLAVLTPQQLTQQLNGTIVHHAELNDVLWDAITAARCAGNLVLCMGAGSIDGWVRRHTSAAPSA